MSKNLEADNSQELSSLSTTIEAFHSRLQKRVAVQRQADLERETAQSERHQKMLLAMTTIRSALEDLVRLDLSNDYSLGLLSDDFCGWPRFRLILVAADGSTVENVCLQVTAHDRHQSGSIEISSGSESKPTVVQLVQAGSQSLLFQTLRKMVRQFLDQLESVILTHSMEAEDEIETSIIEPRINQVEGDKLGDVNLFTEGQSSNDFLESLPEIEQIDSLPGIKGRQSK